MRRQRQVTLGKRLKSWPKTEGDGGQFLWTYATQRVKVNKHISSEKKKKRIYNFLTLSVEGPLHIGDFCQSATDAVAKFFTHQKSVVLISYQDDQIRNHCLWAHMWYMKIIYNNQHIKSCPVHHMKPVGMLGVYLLQTNIPSLEWVPYNPVGLMHWHSGQFPAAWASLVRVFLVIQKFWLFVLLCT